MQYFALKSLKTKLPIPIDLTNCEVSLEPLEIPVIRTIMDASVSVRDENGTFEKAIPGGNFPTISSYVRHLNDVIDSTGVSVSFDERIQKVVVTLCERCSLQVSRRIVALLALPRGVMRGTVYSTRSLHFNQNNLLVFTSNITEKTPFDTQRLPIIHVARLNDQHREMQYFPTIGGTVESINIEVLNSSAEEISTIGSEYFFILRLRKIINS